MTRNELDAALALSEKATPGKWNIHVVECDCDECCVQPQPHHDEAFIPEACVVATPDGDMMSRENADFAAASRELVPALVAEVLRLRMALAREIDVQHRMGGCCGDGSECSHSTCPRLAEARAIIAEEER